MQAVCHFNLKCRGSSIRNDEKLDKYRKICKIPFAEAHAENRVSPLNGRKRLSMNVLKVSRLNTKNLFLEVACRKSVQKFVFRRKGKNDLNKIKSIV